MLLTDLSLERVGCAWYICLNLLAITFKKGESEISRSKIIGTRVSLLGPPPLVDGRDVVWVLVPADSGLGFLI